MRTGIAASVLGIIAVAFWPRLPDWQPLLAAGLLLNFASGISLRWGASLPPVLTVLLRCAGLLMLGTAWHTGVAQHQLERTLPASLEGQDILVSGYVASLPEVRPGGQSFQFRVESGPPDFGRGRILLNSYGSEVVQAGQVWQLKVRLQRPHGFANPATFDYEAWLFQQGISARGYIRNAPENRYLGTDRITLTRWRAALRDRLLPVTAELEFQGLFLALSLGDRAGLPDAQWELFSQTGTNHLVVISGLHVALVAGFCAFLAGRLWRCGETTLNWLPAQQAAALAAMVGALAYSLLAGFALPTQRALIMVCVFMLARLLSVQSSPSFSLLLAALLVLLLDPLAVTGAGFWLSFVAVAALLLVFSGVPIARHSKIRLAWQTLVVPQLVVLPGLLVPLGIWTGGISLLAPVANLLAIPIVSWVLVPLCMLGSLLALTWSPAALATFQLADLVAGLLLAWLQWLVALAPSGTSWPVNRLGALGTLTAASGALLWLLPWRRSSRLLACFMLLPFLWPGRADRAQPPLAVHLLDVGQGLAVIVRTPGHSLVYDSGPLYPSGFDSGVALVVPVLRSLGIGSLDRLIISHGDSDHAGGARGLLAALPVGDVLAGEPLEELPGQTSPCAQGQQWRWEQVQFRILHPEPGGARHGNNSSCVLEIQLDDLRILLPGDVDATVERQLLVRDGGLEKLTVLVSAHHGSNTSSSWTFLAATRPDLVVHSAGYRNQFGHPTGKVRDRIDTLGIAQLLTAEQGMISLYYRGPDQALKVLRYRDQRQRYWHWSDIPDEADTRELPGS